MPPKALWIWCRFWPLLILPAFGLISEIISFFTNKLIFGHLSMVFAMLSISLVGFFVWTHHMWVTGLDVETRAYFSAATQIIAIPTGLKIANWLATCFNGKLDFNICLFYAIGFIFLFVIGGITGIILSNPFLGLSLHDSYFVVAHFHFVLSIAALFAVFAGIFFWLKIFLNINFNQKACIIHFFFLLIGVNCTFLPMHTIGINGLVRRVPQYAFFYQFLNEITTIGSFISFFGIFFFFFRILFFLKN